jgi:DNA replication ATP-dependent helicase Dna2
VFLCSPLTKLLRLEQLNFASADSLVWFEAYSEFLTKHRYHGLLVLKKSTSFQGRDKECIIVSFVRSSGNSRASGSSLLGDWHRINVVLTRAKVSSSVYFPMWTIPQNKVISGLVIPFEFSDLSS